nr:MAG TPA: hypothetical protein [Caudoviricetes sp.]
MYKITLVCIMKLILLYLQVMVRVQFYFLHRILQI